MYRKKFKEWIGLKEKLDLKSPRPPYIKEGHVWWASLGENVGYEIGGKSKLFTRPVIIFKKLSREFYLAIPTTTKGGSGSWYVDFKHEGIRMKACLNQVRTMDTKRLSSKIGSLDREDYMRIKKGFWNLYK